MKNSYRIVLFFVFFGNGLAKAQTLTPKDRKEMAYLSRKLVGETLKDFLNAFTFAELSELERSEISLNSYLPNSNQIFLNEDVIIEDNSDPKQIDSKTTRDVPVSRYLTNLDLFYEKSDTNSIEFRRVVVLTIAQNESPFATVGFQCVFKNAHKTTRQKYQPTERVAEIRFEKRENKWVGFVAGLRFVRPVVAAFVAPLTPVLSSKADIKNARKKINDLLQMGQQAIEQTNDKAKAIGYFSKAQQLSKQLPQTVGNENLLRLAELYERKGDVIFEAEIYANAVQWYRVAQSLNRSKAVEEKIEFCTQK